MSPQEELTITPEMDARLVEKREIIGPIIFHAVSLALRGSSEKSPLLLSDNPDAEKVAVLLSLYIQSGPALKRLGVNFNDITTCLHVRYHL